MISISYKELIRLKDGEPPWSVNEQWDCAMVIEALANHLYFILKPTYGELQEMYEEITKNIVISENDLINKKE